ncbi:MAG: domain S-box protein [Mucilaginibacter sp.]|nr:domain S-box protein [Mucilaginibacter sp.]
MAHTLNNDTLLKKNAISDINNIQLPQLFDQLPVAIYTCDRWGYITGYNSAAVKLWGREPEIGKDLWCGSWKIFKPDGDSLPLDDCPMARVLKEGIAIEGEQIIIQRPDGSYRNVLPYPVPTFDAAGTLIGATNTLIDITGQKKYDENQAMLAAIVDTSDDAIYSKNLKGVISSWNKAAERMFGYTKEEALGKHISLLIPSSRLAEEDIILGNVAQGEKVDHFETIRVAKNGREIPVSLSVSPIRDSTGQIIGASKIARDISDKKQAYENQAMLAAIVDTSDDTIISKNLKGIISSWNRAAERMFGYTKEEVLGKHISLLIPPSRLAEEDIIINSIAQGNKVDHFETIRIAKDGREIPISLSVSPVKDVIGRIVGASKIARDISEKKLTEGKLQQYAQNLEILNSLGKVIAENLDIQDVLQKVTDATTQLAGADFGAFFYNKVDEKGESYRLYTLSGAPKETFENFGMPRNTAVFHPTFSGEKIVRVDDITKDPSYGKSAPHFGMPKGHLPVVSYMAMPVFSKSGSVIGGLFFGHHKPGRFTEEHEQLISAVTAQAAIALDNAKLYEEIKVLNSKKDEFIGLASHELKTPVTSIKGYLQLIERNFAPDDRNKSFIVKASQQVNKLAALISDLLDISKIQTGKLPFTYCNFDLCVLLKEVTDIMRQTNTSHLMELHCEEGLIVEADQQRIEQVIINLISNAVKYSPNDQRIVIHAKSLEDKIRISVQDFGIGIAPDQQERIFSRFYRVENLAAHMSGLGIGLYISHEIIDGHKGKLWVESTSGQGSTFVLEIPVRRQTQVDQD